MGTKFVTLLILTNLAISSTEHLFDNCKESHLNEETFRCDGHVDCADGFDEFNCTSKANCEQMDSFFCSYDSKCIKSAQLCDGIYDCSDGQDETKCTTPQCTDYGCSCNRTFTYEHIRNRCRPRRLCDDHPNLCDRPDSGHTCVNVPGGYQCHCSKGFYNWDTKTCLQDAAKGPTMLLHGGISSVKFHGINDKEQVLYQISRWHDCHSMAIGYSLKNNYVIWAADAVKAIYGAPLFKSMPSMFNAGEPTLLRRTTSRVYKLEVDWIRDRVVFVSYGLIQSFSIDSPSKILELSSSYEPNSRLALNALENFFVWTSRDGKKLIRTSLGNDNDLVLMDSARDRISNVAIDMQGKRIFIVSIDSENVTSMDFNGFDRRTFHIGKTSYAHYAFELFGEYLLLPQDGKLHSISKHGTDSNLKLFAKSGCNFGKLVHPSLQPDSTDTANCVHGANCVKTTTTKPSESHDRLWENYDFTTPRL